MSLLSDLMIIDNQSEPDDDNQILAHIHHYIQSKLNSIDSYILADNGETRLYKEKDKLRLVTLFKKDYEELQAATKNNKFAHENLDEMFKNIYSQYLTKYEIDARLLEPQKSQ